jgi:hypothetical protein
MRWPVDKRCSRGFSQSVTLGHDDAEGVESPRDIAAQGGGRGDEDRNRPPNRLRTVDKTNRSATLYASDDGKEGCSPAWRASDTFMPHPDRPVEDPPEAFHLLVAGVFHWLLRAGAASRYEAVLRRQRSNQ